MPAPKKGSYITFRPYMTGQRRIDRFTRLWYFQGKYGIFAPARVSLSIEKADSAVGSQIMTAIISAVAYQPIGVIHTPFTKPDGMPIQPAGAIGVTGTVEVFDEYRSGLKDLGGFSHIILIYHFHRSKGFRLRVIPFMDSVARGLFATRAPRRPNPIGLSIVQLKRVEGRILHIQNVDILDATPLLDIKPYVPEFDAQSNVRSGWLEQARKKVFEKRSDNRFQGQP